MAKKSSAPKTTTGHDDDSEDSSDLGFSQGVSEAQPPGYALGNSGFGVANLMQVLLPLPDAGGFSSDLIVLDFDSFAKGGQSLAAGGKTGGSTKIPNYVSGDPGQYNIEIVFKGSWTQPFVDIFKAAADLISDYIIGDIPDVYFRGRFIDDLSITAELKAIDGEGGILGQAGPTAIRTGSYLPATGVMQFDVADASAYLAQNLFDDIVLHEMLHVVGFGTVWTYKGLLSGAGTDSPTFTGVLATTAYEMEYLGGADANGIPVEQDGGAGTRDSHWDEQTFLGELMTGYIGYVDGSGHYVPDNSLSYMTVASLGDLGYALDPSLNVGSFIPPDWI